MRQGKGGNNGKWGEKKSLKSSEDPGLSRMKLQTQLQGVSLLRDFGSQYRIDTGTTEKIS